MKRIAIVIALVGCRSEINPAYCVAHEGDPRCPDAGVVPDGPADGATTGDVSTCLGSGLYTVCLATQLPTTNLTVTQDIDTDSTSPCLHFQPPGWVEGGQPPACFVVGVKVTMSSSINARGSRPLVVVATDSLTISDNIDVSAKHGTPTQIPAGFDPLATACAYVTVPADNSNGGGGGAGASFATNGGDGGTGNNAGSQAGLHVPAVPAPTLLRAGCIGQTGGVGDNNGGGGGVGGNGGGAVYLLAGNTITLTSNASIDVSGAGGDNGGHHAGGGGGGSGGMLVMSAGAFSINGAKIYLNGGGGASGGSGGTGSSGNDPSNPTTVATGGTASGGVGGNGFVQGTDATAGAAGGSSDGGGGGGGGGGYLQANHPLTGAAVSPVEVVVP